MWASAGDDHMPWGLTPQGEGEPQSLHFLEPIGAISARRSGRRSGFHLPALQPRFHRPVSAFREGGGERRAETRELPGAGLLGRSQCDRAGPGAQRMQGRQDKLALPRSTLWRGAAERGCLSLKQGCSQGR